MRNVLQFSYIAIIVAVVIGGSACSSNHPKKNTTATIKTTQSAVIKADGVQNINWQIMEIKGQKARFFQQTPSLLLNSKVQHVQGNTGCNILMGKYDIDIAKKTLDFDARAGHKSCDNALAQEAELADALHDVTRFQVNSDILLLQDKYGKTLIKAQKK